MTCFCKFLGVAQPARDLDTFAMRRASMRFHFRRTAQPTVIRGQEIKLLKDVPCGVLGWDAWQCEFLGTVPHIHGLWLVSPGSSLFVRNQTAPDEGYIRHALSYFPTIIPWSWTTTISVPCLPLGYIDPAYVSQYYQWPRGSPISNLCPPHPIYTVRVTFLFS